MNTDGFKIDITIMHGKLISESGSQTIHINECRISILGFFKLQEPSLVVPKTPRLLLSYSQ